MQTVSAVLFQFVQQEWKLHKKEEYASNELLLYLK